MYSRTAAHAADAETPDRPAVEAASLHSLVDWITEATAPITGEDFFQTLIELLATRLGADTALLTQCRQQNRSVAETLAFWHRGALVPNIEFPLAGTPCERVVHDGRFSYVPEGLSERFPDLAREQGGLESFIGVPILCPDTAAVLGHIAVYHRKSMPRDAVTESMFRIIAMRAGAEIQRRRAEQVRLEQEQIARQRLHELAVVSRRASISEMTSAVTHEIRQPLTQIRTYVQAALRLLDRPHPDREKIKHALDQTLSGAQRGEAIVDRLQQWMGRTEMQTERIDAGALIEQTRGLLSSELARTATALEIDIADALPAVTADRVLLQQVIFNLLRNSLEAVQRGGRVNGDGRIRVSATSDESGRLVVDVRDNGDGVPEAAGEDIFKPFSGPTETNGMGIGLSLCRSIVESHGGTLELISPSNPTIFRIMLPASRA